MGPEEGLGARLVAGTLEDGDGDGDDEFGCTRRVGVFELGEDGGEGRPVGGVEERAIEGVRGKGKEEEGGELVPFGGGHGDL